MLAQKPHFYMFDEPTSSLDLRYQIEIMKFVKNVAGAEDSGIVIVFHDLNIAFRYADKVLLLNDRAVHNTGCPKDVLTEDVIKDVYGVRAKIIDTEDGPFILVTDSCRYVTFMVLTYCL